MNKTHRQSDPEPFDDVGIRAVFVVDEQGLKMRLDDVKNHRRTLGQYCKSAYSCKVTPEPIYAQDGFIHYQISKPTALPQCCSSDGQGGPGEQLQPAPSMGETIPLSAAPCKTSPMSTESAREACDVIVLVNGRPVMRETDFAPCARRAPRRTRSVEFQLSGASTSHLITDKKQHVTLESGNAPEGAVPGMLVDAIVERMEVVVIAGADAIDLQMDLPLVDGETE